MQPKSLKILGKCLRARPTKRGEVPPVLVPRDKTLSFSSSNLAEMLMGHVHLRKWETNTMLMVTAIPDTEKYSRMCN